MEDLLLIETKNGGDLVRGTNDLIVTQGYGTMIYLSLFGGDKWWGNELLMSSQDMKYSSKTETALRSITLDSKGRIALENAVKSDLSTIATVLNAEISVIVRITSESSAEISIKINGESFAITLLAPNIEMPYWRLTYTGIFSEQFTEQFT